MASATTAATDRQQKAPPLWHGRGYLRADGTLAGQGLEQLLPQQHLFLLLFVGERGLGRQLGLLRGQRRQRRGGQGFRVAQSQGLGAGHSHYSNTAGCHARHCGNDRQC